MGTTNLESYGFTKVIEGGIPPNNPVDVIAPAIITGSGEPTVVAPKGTIYLRSDSAGQTYQNTDGATSWSLLSSVPGGMTGTLTTGTMPVASGATTLEDSILLQPSSTEIRPTTDGDINFGNASVAVFNSFRGYSFGDVNVSSNAIDPNQDSYAFGERITISGTDSEGVGEVIDISGSVNQVLGERLTVTGDHNQGVGSRVSVDGSDVQFLGEELTVPSPAGQNSSMIVIGQGLDLTAEDHTGEVVLGITAIGATVDSDGLHAANGDSGSFTTDDGKTVTVVDGIITSIAGP